MTLRVCQVIYDVHYNTNALNLIRFSEITPHPIPLPNGERGG
jgi:hypothetical protein